MVGSLLEQHVRAKRLSVIVKSAGFDDSGGETPTDTAVRLLQARGIDVSGYQSHILSTRGVTGADLIVTSEHRHVVSIAGRWPLTYRYTFTLPELVELGERVGPLSPRSFPDWLDALHDQRPDPIDYLDIAVGEIEDPTGRSPATWSACFARIDDLTSRLADLLG
jgi:protein-tyrosine-phosphatase